MTCDVHRRRPRSAIQPLDTLAFKDTVGRVNGTLHDLYLGPANGEQAEVKGKHGAGLFSAAFVPGTLCQ